MLKLWGRVNSINVMKVLWCLDELGIEYDRIDAGMEHGVVNDTSYRAMNPNGRVPKHRDATEEFIYVLEGNGTITIDGVAYPVRPGTSIYMPAKAEVSFRGGAGPLVAVQVFAGPAPAAKYAAWKPASKGNK